MAEIVELCGRRYRCISVDEVVEGDFIKTGRNAVAEVERVDFTRFPDGRIKEWSIRCKDGRNYDMRSARLYLRPDGQS